MGLIRSVVAGLNVCACITNFFQTDQYLDLDKTTGRLGYKLWPIPDLRRLPVNLGPTWALSLLTLFGLLLFRVSKKNLQKSLPTQQKESDSESIHQKSKG
jgi:hypothetical protein